MAITSTAYLSFLSSLLPVSSYKAVLVTSAYTRADTDQDYSAISGAELANDTTAGGYTTGGADLSNVAVTTQASNTTVTADPVTWNTLTGTFRYVVVYRRVGTSGSALVTCIDLGADRTFTAEPCQVSFTNGIVSLTLGS